MSSTTTPSPSTEAAPTSQGPSSPPSQPCPLCGRIECADEVEAYLHDALRGKQR